MKIVQSLWSKPGQQNGNADFSAINKCGWADRKYNYFSWALSALQFRKFYDEVELVTDKAGYKLLIEQLGLPYTSVKVVLDDLNGYHQNLYALGKIYAYGIQNKPFIHADGDVYIWEKFDTKLENSSLIGQHKEQGDYYQLYYEKIYNEMMSNFSYWPESLEMSVAKSNGIVAINAGILGGNNISFFKYYVAKAFEFVDKNIRSLDKIDVSLSNTVFEQVLFYALSIEKGEAVTCYNPDFVFYWSDITDFTGIPNKTKYIHAIGALKRDRHVIDALEYRLQADYPTYYDRIMNLVRTNQI